VSFVYDRYGHLLPGHEDSGIDALDAMATDAAAKVRAEKTTSNVVPLRRRQSR
jgi:hypothetical protein